MNDFTKSIRSIVLITFFGIISILIPQSVYAQPSEGGTPKSFELSKVREFNGVIEFDEIVLRAPNVDQLKSEDVQSGKDGTPPRVGTSLPISASKSTAGTWTDLPDGGKLWTLKIHSHGAKALSVFFDQFYLAPGSKIFFYNENRKQVIGAFTHNNNKDNGTFATEMIQGESIYIEYYEPKLKRGISTFHIASVGYFYEELYGLKAYKDDNTKAVNSSDACEVNINCTPVGDDWQDEKRGVAQITFLAGGGWYLCSGTLINNTAYDATPYFLTAFHCGAADVNDATELPQWVFKFKYESPDCNNLASEPATSSLTGCTRVADGNISGGSDFFLLLLDNTPTSAQDPYYNGWDLSGTTSTGVGIHHPSGDIKKISTYGSIAASGSSNISGDIMAANSSWTVGWVSNANGWGVTEGGSSGSPLFNSNGLQIGTLTGGSSYCTDQTATDIYGRMTYHWDQNAGGSAHELQPWLDPANNTTTLPGFDPFATAPPVVDFEGYPTTVIQGSTVDFYNYTENSPTSHAWTFENGTPGTSTDINPTGITYNTVGLQDVTLTSSNANGPASLTKTDYIDVVDPSSTFCDTISQFCCTPMIYTTGNGYVCGTNEYDMTQFSEKFTTYDPYNQITGARFYIADADNGTSPDVTFNMYDVSGDNPGSVIASQTVPLADVVTAFNNDGFIDVTFPSATDIPIGGFFLGFERPGTPASGDSLALISNSEDGYMSTAYTLYEGNWVLSSNLWTDMVNFQHAIYPFACYVGTLSPVADFNGVPTRVEVGNSVQFNDATGGTPATSWNWTFPGGTPDATDIPNPLVTYNTIGFYDVSMSISNANGTDAITKTSYIEVFDPSGTNAFTLDFEACSDFQLDDFLPWTTNDQDGSATYTSSGFDFTNEGYTGSFIAFNSGSTTPEATGWEAHGGSLCGICFAASTPPNNDWLISDQITLGNTSSFAFWAKSITDAYGLEKFNVLVSTTDNQPASFTNISGGTIDAPLAWTEFTYDLSAYDGQTVYIAVQCVSNDAFAFMIDDIEISSTYPPPVADFSADQTNVPMGTTVNFTDLTTNGPTSWDWSFPGGTPASSTDQNPSIVYNTIGTYQVELTATNSTSTDTETKIAYITVTEVPDVIVEWNFDDNNAVSDAGILVNDGTKSIVGNLITDIQYTGNANADGWASAAGDSWVVDFETTGYGSLKLSFGQMSDNARSPRDFEVEYSLDGTVWNSLTPALNITLVEGVWNNTSGYVLPAACEDQGTVYLRWVVTSIISCSGSTIQDNQTNKRNYIDDIIITGLPLNAPPVAEFSGTPTTVCQGQSVTFTDASTGTPTSWNWDFGDGGTSTSQNPTYTYNTAGTYAVELEAINGNGNDIITKPAYITVNPSLPASVSIVEDLNNICNGTSVTFTATPVNGGTPSYQWKLNGVNVGADSDTYTSTTLTNGDAVTVEMTSSEVCATGSPATSNSIVMNVTPVVVASVSIAEDQNNICVGTNVTFNATPTNGGTPTYQWLLNGGNVGGNSPTYANNTLTDGDVVTLEMTSSLTCVSGSPATSNAVNMTVNPILPASVSIVEDLNNICDGTNVTFTATPNNGGTPTYQWKLNGGNVGTGLATYSNNTLADGDVVTLEMTSNLTCISGNPATSNAINMIVNPNLPVSVSIAEDDNNICDGTNVTFTATPNNGGTPTYQWKLNGVNVGTGLATYSNNTLINGDVITVEMASDLTCVTGNPATSNAVNMVVNPILPVSVTIVEDDNNICDGTNVTFAATPTNGGTPTYQWKLNGGNVGTGLATYSNNTLNNGDVVTVEMTSSETCVSGSPATSNAINMIVNPILPASVTIVEDDNNICAGTNVTFTATPNNGGTPTYQWKLNGGNVGTGLATYTNNTLTDGDVVTLEMTSDLTCISGNPATSNAINMNVNPNLPVGVSIVEDDNSICDGTNVTFTATPINGGTPTYQWKLNGVNVGTGLATYSNNTLINGDVITVEMASDLTCVTGNPATSNAVNMVVNPILPVSVTIVEDDNNICDGTNVTFAATPTNGGTPTYQWKLNGGNVGTGLATYSNNTLNNGDVVTVEMTSSETCVSGSPATSNAINMIVNPILPASVTIVEDDNNICAGTNVTFTATPNNGGTPTYQWKLNGSNVGTGLATYSNNTLADSDVVTLEMTSNLTCISGNPATSNAINMIVNPNLPVSVSIAEDDNNICDGTNVTFTATPVNGGTPTYQWKLNGVNVGTGLSSYSNNTLINGDVITVEMTSNLTCVTGNPATSNAVNMVVNPILPVSVTIVEDDNNICDGTNVTFAATPTNGGTPTYQWKLNGGNVGTGLATYSNNTLNNGDVVTVEMTSSETCVSGSPATSNAINMIVNPILPASVTIVEDDNNICAGTNVTFTATPINGGTPTYQWKLNGGNIGTGLATYANNTLADGDVVTVEMASDLACVSGNPATSNAINMTVNPNLPVSVSIVEDQNNICDGTNVTFTANPTNGGTPTYQWKLNGVNVGTGLSSYSNNTLTNGDVVTVEMASDLTCVTGNPATSNAVNMVINPILPVSVTIVEDNNNICAGDNVTFTATPTSGGTPTYQWLLNGVSVGGNSPTYANNTLADGDVVAVEMTSSETCVSGSPATSNAITLTVLASPTITLQPTNATIGDGGSTSFSVTATGDGLNYQWQVSTDGGSTYNNITASGSNPSYLNWASPTLNINSTVFANDGFIYQCIITGTCAPVVSSDEVTLTVNSAPAITLHPANTNECNGAVTNFNVMASGTITGYQWQVSTDGGLTYNNILAAGANPTYANWNTNNLSLAGITPVNNGYMYKCIVQGTPDATSNAATLNVSLPPLVTLDPSDATLCEGDGTSFSITANGDGLTYQWQVSTDGGTVYNNITAAGTNPTYTNWNTDNLSVNGTISGNDGYMYRCIVTGTCAPAATSSAATITINPLLPVSVSIVADNNDVCDGTNITFTATPVNGGIPSYQWKVNGVSVGADSPTFSSNSLANGNTITVEMTSSLTCISGNPATSNAINMIVNPILPASVTIVEDLNNICEGTNVTFTATPINGGTPTFQWLLNGISVGGDSPTYANNTLVNGDNVTVEMTSSEACVSGNPATSNAVSMTVNPNLLVSITIVEDLNNICDGTSVTFDATPTNGGITPSYDWLVNGASVGAPDMDTYTSTTLSDGDVVSVVLTSSETCVTGNPANSNTVNMTVNPILAADVSILADINTICLGSTVTFDATPVNGGTPSYIWFVNGVNVGAPNSATYTTSSLNDSDFVYCKMTSSETCVTNSPATSNTETITVNSALPVSVIITPDANPVCDAQNVTFTATPTNGGTTPSYDWLVNSISVGAPDMDTYSSATLNDGDVVEVVLTSSESCATGNPTTSNAVNMTVNSNLPVSVTIVEDLNNICDGTSVTFDATPTNGGITPSYDWLVNGASVGAPDMDTYTSTTLSDGDVVSVVLTSSETCVTGNPATSNDVNMTVNPVLNADVSIVADNEITCSGTTVTFDATPVNGGTPSYVWYVNGVNVGAPDLNTFTNSSLNDGDMVYCEMTSDVACATNTPATSNSVTVTINPTPIVPIVDVQCTGTGGAGVVAVTDPIGAEYTYSIDGVTFQPEAIFSDVANGTYNITIDQGGCTNISDEFTIDCTCDNPTTLSLTTTDGIACNNEDYVLSGNTFGGNASEVIVTHNGNGTLEESTFTNSPFDIVYIADATDLNTDITFTVSTDDPAGDLCDAVSDQFVITVHEAPVVDLPETANACEGEEFSYTLTETYDYAIWVDAIESHTFTSNYTYAGDYEVWVWVENSFCAAQDTMTVIVTVCSGIDQALNNGRFNIYPNPTRNNCNLSIDNFKGELNYSLVDIQGKIITSKKLNVDSELIEEINIEDLVPGMYFIKLSTKNETINFKLIKN